MNSQKQQRPSGFKCPVCEGFVPVSIAQLLTSEQFLCPSCGLEIKLNRNDSQNALNALQKVHNAEENVKRASVFNGNRMTNSN